MSELKKYKLGDVAQVIGGGTPSTTKEEYWNGEIGWLTPRDLTGYSYKYISKGERNITEEGLKNSSARLIPEGTVLMTSRAPIGYLAIAGKELCTNQGFKSFIVDEDKINNEYLYYLLKSNIDRIKSLGTGSTFAEVSASILKSFEIEIPDTTTQKEIASILSSLDDKIELNLQMNQTLEAMAQAIFKEWFVDFNFPGFDGELVDGLPKGWKVVELSSLISVKDGTHDSPKQQQEGKYLITSKHLKNHFIDFSNAYKISDDDFNKVNKRSKVDRLDILITMIGTVGNLYFVHESKIDFAIKNIGLFKASERPDLAYFLYFTIDSKETSEYFIKRLAGSTQQYLTLETLRQTPVLLPDYETLNTFNEYARTIYERIDINSQNIQSLTQTRDTLLPKLISGQLEIS